MPYLVLSSHACLTFFSVTFEFIQITVMMSSFLLQTDDAHYTLELSVGLSLGLILCLELTSMQFILSQNLYLGREQTNIDIS